MNIHYFFHYARLPTRPGPTRDFDIAKHIVKRGHQLTMIASAFDHMTHEMNQLGTTDWYSEETHQGVRFVEVWSRPYSSNSPNRFLNTIDYSYYAWRYARLLEAPTIVVGVVNHHLTALIAWLHARYHRVPFVLQVADVWPDTLIDMGMSPQHPVVLFYKALDRFLLPRADCVISSLPLATNRLAVGRTNQDGIYFIPNGVELSDLETDNDVAPKDDSQFIVMYAGTHGPVNALETIIHAAEIVSYDPQGHRIKFVLIGDGPDKLALQQLAHQLDLKNVEFRPAVPKQKIFQELRQADAFIFHFKNNPVFTRFGISPNKVWEYMGAARPIIFACNSANDPVAEANAGISIPAEDPLAMANAVLQMATLPHSERLRIGQSARLYAETNVDIKVIADKYLQLFEETCQKFKKR